MPLSTIRSLFASARRQVRTDLDEDPYLPYVLVLTTALSLFWIWHRIPNFATIDEWSRLVDPTVVFGRFIDDPSFESLRAGFEWGRVPFGATFYLFGLALLPVILLALVTGQLDVFSSFGFPSWDFRYYDGWQAMPRWVWTWSLLLVRLFTVAFAVGCVYLTYRIGTAGYDRRVGRLSALLLTLSFGFISIAHEAGEDIPALFFVLLSLYLVLRYVQTGDGRLFLAGSAAGGVAISFKLTTALVILVIVTGFVLRGRHTERWRDGLLRPRVFVGGAALGLVFIVLGFPTLLVGEIDLVVERLFTGAGRATRSTGPDAPVWWWFLRGYFSGLSLPLFLAGFVGVLAGIVSLRNRESGFDATVLLLAVIAVFLLLFSRWHDFRVHHLLPTFPFIVLLLSDRLDRLRAYAPTIGRAVIAILVVTAGVYAVVGTVGYASMPRDQSVAWLNENADENDTVEVYRRTFQDTAVPFGTNVNYPEVEDPVDCPRFIQLGYRDLLYLDEDAFYYTDPRGTGFISDLLSGEYNYEVAETFGPEPAGPGFTPDRPTPGSLTELFRLGVIPHTSQYGDEQELRNDQFIVILERTGPCEKPRDSPF